MCTNLTPSPRQGSLSSWVKIVVQTTSAVTLSVWRLAGFMIIRKLPLSCGESFTAMHAPIGLIFSTAPEISPSGSFRATGHLLSTLGFWRLSEAFAVFISISTACSFIVSPQRCMEPLLSQRSREPGSRQMGAQRMRQDVSGPDNS